MKPRWLFLGTIILAGILYLVGQFWHPSLPDTISILIVALIWMFIYLAGQAAQLRHRLDSIEAELKKKSNSPDLEGFGRNIESKIEGRLKNFEEEPADISNRLAELERRLDARGIAIAWQLECTRRLQQINEGTRKLRTMAEIAVPPSGDKSGEKGTVHSVPMLLLGSIQQEAEAFILPFFGREHLSVLCMRLEKIQEILREATLASPALSMEQIESEARRILQELGGIREWAKTIEDEEISNGAAEIRGDRSEA